MSRIGKLPIAIPKGVEINVSDKNDIKEFLQNIDKKSSDKISDLIKEINQIGIKRTNNI